MDDDDDIRETMTQILEELELTAETVADDKQAIDIYQEAVSANRPFDLVILDLTIPGKMGRVDVAIKILEIDAQANLIGSRVDSPIIANFAEYGFKGVITKPYKFDKVSEIPVSNFGQKVKNRGRL